MLATLNIIIGLVFVLLLFSLLASTVMEVLAAFLSLRGKQLHRTLENMLGELLPDFIRHPLFRQLAFATNQRTRISPYALPAWISKDTFRSILIDILDASSPEDLEEKIKGLDEGDLKRMMQFIYRQSGGDLAAFQTQTEQWFDEVMDRASDWYKRSTKWWLFGVGFVLAAVFNADTIQIYQNISNSTVLQNMLANDADRFIQKTDTVTGPQAGIPLDVALARYDTMQTRIESLRSPLGLGWNSNEAKQNLPWWLVKIAGLLVTGIAVTFGAPFWFEILKKLVSIRPGAKPAESAPAPPAAPPPAPIPPRPVATPKPEKVEPAPVKSDAPATGRGKPVG